jgi:4-diphosphocytidyl-2-C-methyl-D-erythritol kinase
VPLFVRGQSAWAEGVGEQLTAVELPEKWFVVVTPEINASTAQLFADGQLTRDARPIKIRDYFDGGGEDGAGKVAKAMGNAFEPVARRRFPEIAAALDYLSQQAGKPARLSGTGASVFVEVDTEPQAQSIAATIPAKWRYFVAKAINQSPSVL